MDLLCGEVTAAVYFWTGIAMNCSSKVGLLMRLDGKDLSYWPLEEGLTKPPRNPFSAKPFRLGLKEGFSTRVGKPFHIVLRMRDHQSHPESLLSYRLG